MRKARKSTTARRRAKQRTVSTAISDDTELLALVARFDALYQGFDKLRAHQHEARAAAEAHPAYPKLEPVDSEAVHRQIAFWQARGGDVLFETTGKLGESVGEVAQAIFATPAHTLPGILAKLRIVELAYGAGDPGDPSTGGDVDLEAYQGRERSWLRSTIEDIECVAGAGDPVLALCAEWWRTNTESEAVTARGKDLHGEAAKRHEAELAEVLGRQSELIRRIVATPPSTAAGALAMVAIAGELVRQEGFEKRPPNDIVEALVWAVAREAKRLSRGAA